MKSVYPRVYRWLICHKYINLLFVSIILQLSVMAQPAVVTQPRDTAVCVETTVGFQLVAINTTSYLWQEFDGVGWYNLDATFTYVTGQNTPNLTIIDANLALNGYKYRCIVMDINGLTDTSRVALLGVYDPPIILENPANDRVCKNQVAFFSVDVLNSTHYRWQEYNAAGWINLENNAFYNGVFTPDLSVYTVLGMNNNRYRCIVTNVSCPDTTNYGVLTVDPTPVAFTVTGGGKFCDGGTGVAVGLSGSELSITYNLLHNGLETGQVRPGTGTSLSFGLQNQEGIYTIRAYNEFTPCTSIMNDMAIVGINALPDIFEVQGGGAICEGEQGLPVFLLSSQVGVSYELYKNAVSTGLILSGNGFGLSFDNQQQAGIYTVLATNQETGCVAQMTGHAELVVNVRPQVDAGPDQVTVQGSTVLLSGTIIPVTGNYTYSWTPQSLCVNPQAKVTDTHPLYVSSLFLFSATNAVTGCYSTADTCVVYVSDGPLNVQIVQSSSDICAGEQVQLNAIAGGGSGNYSYSWTSSPPGFVSNLPNPVVSPTETTVYQLVLSDGEQTVMSSVTIEVFAVPQQFNLNNGGNYCQGDNGIQVTLSSSQQGLEYRLYHNQLEVSNKTGSGQMLDFGLFTDSGSYTAVAENAHGCQRNQNGIAVIGIHPLPLAEAGINKVISSGQSTTLEASASGGNPPYEYSWVPASLLINPSNPTPATVALNQTQLFTLEVEDANSCAGNTDNMVVIVTGGEPTVTIYTSGYPVCPASAVTLYAMASGGTGNFSYLWQSNPAGFTSTLYNPTVFPEVTTTYTVMVNDGLQVLTSSVTVEVNPSPQHYLVSGGGSACEGNSTDDIMLSGSEQGTQYQLFRNGVAVNGQVNGSGYALNFGPQSLSGEYTVFAVRNSTQCTSMMEGSAQVTIYPLPLSDAGSDQLVNSGTAVTLSGTVTGGSGNYSYNWQPSALCLNPQSQNTETVPLTQSSMFTYKATDQSTMCTSKRDTVYVFVQGGQNIYAQASASPGIICQGEEVQLTVLPTGGTGNYQISWSSNPVGFYSASVSPTAYPQVSTHYYVQVFDGVLTAYDTVFVEVMPPPAAFTVTGGGGFCFYDDGLSIGLTGSQTGTTYSLWREPGQEISTLTGTGQSLSFANVTTAGSYSIQAVNQQGCMQMMNGQAVVEVYSAPVANAGTDKTIMQSAQAILEGSANNGSGLYVYNWLPSDSLEVPTSQTPQTVPLHTTNIFHLQVVDGSTGCHSQTDDVVVMVTGGPMSLSVVTDASNICPGDETQLYALVSGGNGNYSYSWTSNPAGFTSTLIAPVVSPAQTTTYFITVNDGAETVSSSIQITVNVLPIAFSVGGGGSVCAGDDPDAITLSGSQSNNTYRLLKNGSSTGITRAGNGFPLQFGVINNPGSYSVVAIDNVHQCSNNMAGNAVVTINQLPMANGGPDKIIPVNSSTVLTGSISNGSGGSFQYLWQPQALVLSPQSSATQTVNLSQSTMFRFSAINIATGCHSSADTVYVFTTGSDLYANILASTLSVCSGEQVDLVSLAGGGSGNYSYSWTSDPLGTLSTQQSISVFPSTSTTYFVEVFDGNSSITSSVHIQVANKPNVYTVTGGGGFCPDQSGVVVGLSGSQEDVEYQLYVNPQQPLISISGTGQPLTFGNFTQEGTYSVRANTNQMCFSDMNGEARIIPYASLTTNAGPDQTIAFGDQILLWGNATGGSEIYQFEWQPTDSLVNPENREALTIPLHSTTLFNLHAQDVETGCQGADDETVVFITGGLFHVDLFANNENVCSGETVNLYALPTGGSGVYSYVWLSNPAGFSSTIYNPSATVIVPSWFKVIVSDGTTSISDSIMINVLPTPLAFDLTGGGVSCEGFVGDSVYLSGSEPGTTYELWNNQTGELNSVPGSGNSINFGVQQEPGYYWVMALNNYSGCGHAMNDTVEVQIIDSPVADAGMDQYIQHGTSAQLYGTASGGGLTYTFSWAPAYFLNNPFLQQPQTIPLESTTNFYLNVTDIQSGCTSTTDQTTVFVLGGPLSVVVSVSNNPVCVGESAVLEALPTGGSGNYSYLWTSIPVGFVSNNPNPVISPQSSTQYIVEVNDGINHVFDTILVSVNQQPIQYLLTGGGGFCFGNQSPNIHLSGSESGVQYKLYRNNMAVAQKAGTGAPIDFGYFAEAGLYFAEASFAGNGCMASMPGSVQIWEEQLPIVDAGPDRMIAQGQYTTLAGSANGGSGVYQYSWSPSTKLLNPGDPDATTIPLDATTLFTLAVEDLETGCTGQPSNAIVFVSGGALTVHIISSTQSVCPGGQLILSALPGGGTGQYTYFWESSPTGFYATGQEVLITPLQATWYNVLVTDGQTGVVDSILITPYELPDKWTLSGGGAYCSGGDGKEIVLNNSASSVSYELYFQTQTTGIYQTGTGAGIDFGAFFAPGIYSVVATSNDGCRTEMANSVSIEEADLPKSFQVVGGGTFCENDPTLGILLESSQLNTTYSLLLDGVQTDISRQGTGLPLGFGGLPESGIYSVVAMQNISGCTNTMTGSSSYIIHSAPDVVIAGDTALCLGDSILLQGSGAMTYEWNTFPIQYTSSIRVSPQANTNYTLIGYTSQNCPGEASHYVIVSEKLTLTLLNDQSSMLVTAYPEGLEAYTFEIGGELIQSGPKNYWSYSEYAGPSDTLMVTGFPKNGCGDEAFTYVDVEEAPNAFTPNGDGKNDLFLPGVEIRVFSSWGGELFHGNEGWDGRYQGKLVVPGTYYYVRPVYDGDGTLIKTIKGSVTVVIE